MSVNAAARTELAACACSLIIGGTAQPILRNGHWRNFCNADRGFEPEVRTIDIQISIKLPESCKCDAVEEADKIACVVIDDLVVAAAIRNTAALSRP